MVDNVKISKFPNISKSENNKKPGTYILKQESTNKMYVGSTGDLYTRIKSHISKLQKNKSGNRLLQEAFNTNPNFELKIIQTENREKAFDLEQELLNKLNFNNEISLNIAKDARIAQKGISSLLGYKMAEDVKKKISKANLGKPKSEEHINTLTEVRRNKARNVSIDGVFYRSCGDAADSLGLDYNTVYNRCSKKIIGYDNWKFIN